MLRTKVNVVSAYILVTTELAFGCIIVAIGIVCRQLLGFLYCGCCGGHKPDSNWELNLSLRTRIDRLQQ